MLVNKSSFPHPTLYEAYLNQIAAPVPIAFPRFNIHAISPA